jgi:superfamily I DNA and/or RNA helicase
MHPDISSLIKHTYPSLQDHSSVLSRPAVKGISSRITFITHTQPELQASQKSAGQWSASSEFQSKVNMYEVRMSVAVVRYLLQQGYQAEQLVLLTPYLGQLLEIQREMSSQDLQVLLAELDIRDLKKAALPAALSGINDSKTTIKTRGSTSSSSSSSSAASPRGGGVRVATIDNYQGEEADVVVASLVRCNDQGRIGFLKEPERINVLLSRAKHGMIIIGSASCLRNASSIDARRHWGVVLDLLEASGSMSSGLPAVCQQHGRSLPLLDSPEAFSLHAPGG